MNQIPPDLKHGPHRDGKCDTLAAIIPVKIFPLPHLTEIGQNWAENEENSTKLAFSSPKIEIYWIYSRESATSIPSLFSPLFITPKSTESMG